MAENQAVPPLESLPSPRSETDVNGNEIPPDTSNVVDPMGEISTVIDIESETPPPPLPHLPPIDAKNNNDSVDAPSIVTKTLPDTSTGKL